MRELLRTARVNTVATLVQRRHRPDRATYLGQGKLEELEQYAQAGRRRGVVCDDELSAAPAAHAGGSRWRCGWSTAPR